MQLSDWSLIILAAGKGTRMGGETPKPLVQVRSKQLIEPILEVGEELFPSRTVVVLSDATRAVEATFPGRAQYVYGSPDAPIGTAGSTRVGLEAVATPKVIVCHADDSHLYTPELLTAFIEHFTDPASIGATFDHLDSSYWRVVQSNNLLVDFVNPQSNATAPVFMALYGFSTVWIREKLATTSFALDAEQGLPFLLRTARVEGAAIHVQTFPAGVWHGVNTPEEVALLRNIAH